MYCTVIKHSGHLRILEKCRKHSPAARVFYISLVFSNDHRVLSQCNTLLRLLYLLNNPASIKIGTHWVHESTVHEDIMQLHCLRGVSMRKSNLVFLKPKTNFAFVF